MLTGSSAAIETLNILLIHNHYRAPGGEDAAVKAERDLLASAGHRVVQYLRYNHEIRQDGLSNKVSLGARTIWARDSVRELQTMLQRQKPDVAHFHNTFPLVSPAAYYTCRKANVPVIQTLHNYRLLCPAATFFRDGHICEECVDHTLWRGIRYGCYRDSHLATATVALMLASHRVSDTWTEMVDCYIAGTHFARGKFIQAGLPADKVVVKPHFVHPDPGVQRLSRHYATFVGRLSAEKGLLTLLAAWGCLGNRFPLRIIGDGPMRARLEAESSEQSLSSVTFQGSLPHDQALAAMQEARLLIFPSECYEGFPMVVAEAFACGVPVIASRLGAMAEIIEDGRTGLHFTVGDAEDLAAKVAWAWVHSAAMAEMGKAARRVYEERYTAERNYELLLQIYDSVRSRTHSMRQPCGG